MNFAPPLSDYPDAADGPVEAEACSSIATVERETGIPKDTLRVWERRYGFPQPSRDGFGERTYPREQIDKLRMVKRLLDVGHRPGKLIQLDMDALSRMGEPRELRRNTTGRRAYTSEKRLSLKSYMDLVHNHDVAGLRRQLVQSQLQMGVERFVTERIAPLSLMVVDAGLRGHLPTFAQHAFTESAKRVLYGAVSSMSEPPTDATPRVLLTTFAQEYNSLGILMAEVMLRLGGCACASLGVQTPVFEVMQAAAAYRAHIVVLSFSDNVNPSDLIGGLEQLRQALPNHVEVWVCGPCPTLIRKPVSKVLAIPALESVAEELARWRNTHTPA